MHRCGQCVRIECTAAACMYGTPTVAMVTNSCEDSDCGRAASQSLWDAVTGGAQGSQYSAQWEYVACTNGGVVSRATSIRLKIHRFSSHLWLALQPENSVMGIEKMEIKVRGRNVWLIMTLDSSLGYYFVIKFRGGGRRDVNATIDGLLETPYSVRFTSADGAMVQQDGITAVESNGNSTITTAVQFDAATYPPDGQVPATPTVSTEQSTAQQSTPTSQDSQEGDSRVLIIVLAASGAVLLCGIVAASVWHFWCRQKDQTASERQVSFVNLEEGQEPHAAKHTKDSTAAGVKGGIPPSSCPTQVKIIKKKAASSSTILSIDSDSEIIDNHPTVSSNAESLSFL